MRIEIVTTNPPLINPYITKIFSGAIQEATQGKRILIIQCLKTALVSNQNDFSKIKLCSDNLVWIRGEFKADSEQSILSYQGDFQGFDKVILESPIDEQIMKLEFNGDMILINPGFDLGEIDDQIVSITNLRRFD